jgi:hypothetical protein
MHDNEQLNMPLAGDGTPPSDPARPALVVLVASVTELIAAAVRCSYGACVGISAYAVTAGAVSTCLSFFVLAALRYDDLMPAVALDLVPHAATFLLVWWVFGWLVLTFVRPFANLSNGFFACWAALVGSVWLVRSLLPSVNGFLARFIEAAHGTLAEKAYVAALMATSTFVWIEASILYSMPPHDGVLAWTVAVGVVSTVACFVFLAGYDELKTHSRHFALGLLAWWAQGLIISFVPTAVTDSVNGFVSIWLSVALAGYVAFGSHAAPVLPSMAADAPHAASSYGPVGAGPSSAATPQVSGFEGFGSAPPPLPAMQAPPPLPSGEYANASTLGGSI